ncbi:MAG: site-specific integrase [Actinobacteria bacterium]|nr:site-specific integrase [Actinomycetota bacterium]
MPPYQDKRTVNGKTVKRWRYKFQLRGKQYSGSTAKLNNTRAAAAALERVRLATLDDRISAGKMPTLVEYADVFLANQKRSAGLLTHEGQTSHLHKHVLPTHGHLHLDAFYRRHAEELKQRWLDDGAARSTINTRLDTLQRMLSYAAETDVIRASPKLKRLSTDHKVKSIKYLTDAQVAELVDSAPPQWASMLLVAARTGMRIGELRALKWAHLNFDTRVIAIVETNPGRPDMPETSPKSGKQRTVPMTDEVHAALLELKRTSAWIWPALEWHGRGRDGGRSQSGCQHGIRTAAKAAGLKNVTWHVLRHTYASALVMRGVSLMVVQELLGHANAKQTAVYAHLAPGFAHHAAVAALDLPLLTNPSGLHLSSTAESAPPERPVIAPGADK